MKKWIPVFMALLFAAPAMAADDAAARKAQCESWATEEGLQGQEATEYVAECMDEGKDSAASEEDTTNASK